MKKRLVLLVLSAGLFTFLSAQEVSVPEKKVVRGSDEKLYVNKDLGVYLWISTSPDPDSEKIRLESDSSARYTNPMYFDTEGYNTVRSPSAVDTATKRVVYPQRDIIFEVYADGLHPVTKSSFRSASYKLIEGKKYYGSDLQIELNPLDAVSGVDKVYTSLNGKAYQTYSSVLKGFNEGENTLKFYAVDKVGNTEPVNEEKFYIDNKPPKTAYSIEGGQSEQYLSASSKIVLSATDDLSGVQAIYYQINSGSFVRYTAPIAVSRLQSENAQLSFYAVDKVGNKEQIQRMGGKPGAAGTGTSAGGNEGLIFEFYVDDDPPELSVNIDGDQYQGKYLYISARSKIVAMAQDEKAGVNKIYYSLNSNTVDQNYTSPVSINAEGLYYFRAKADDYVGNISPVKTIGVFVDTEAPEVIAEVGKPKFESRDTLFVSSNTVIGLKARDDHSGTAEVSWSLDNGESTNIGEKITIEKEGSHTIYYSARDHVNNTRERETLEVFVDNQPPVVHYHFSVESIGTKTVRDERYTIYPANVMLYIAATDARSGGERLEYSINGQPLQTANPVKGFSPGNYVIQVKAYDVLGNMSTEEIKFAIEK